MHSDSTLVWFRLDLRLEDNPALLAASQAESPVVPIFIWAPEEEEPWPPGAASRWWLHQSLSHLEKALRSAGSRLIIRRGPTDQAFDDLLEETGARTICWNDRYEPAVSKRDENLKRSLRERGIRVQTFNSSLLFPPETIAKNDGQPFQVFTAFWKACLKQPAPPEPAAAPEKLLAPRHWPKSLPLQDLELEPKIDWAGGIRAAWTPGEQGAQNALRLYLDDGFAHYATGRNPPALRGTSRLSPHLHFGEISPRRIWHSLRSARNPRNAADVDAYLRELGWREFAYHLLVHFPFTTNQPLRPEFAGFPWRKDRHQLKAWQRGRTGYPLVDAGMRELWTTGWMHNRVRLVVASFLTKHLRMHWEEGAYWFWDTLVDADLANNTLGWQWSAGSGADAAPYFRIFNPVLQSEKFDPDGEYIRRWVPELGRLPAPWIHKPWQAPPLILTEAGVELGRDYPLPLVDHDQARAEALAAFEQIRAHR
ncbi:MAG TPA: deoxyribodipyrimidine photo-lyase [Bryobacteraceae bacterium]|nr:deoxyribodipyrimidine photo-lyase [Bryobacteraceae bacterium]